MADERLLAYVREMAKLTQMEFVDYLIARLDSDEFYSWRESMVRLKSGDARPCGIGAKLAAWPNSSDEFRAAALVVTQSADSRL